MPPNALPQAGPPMSQPVPDRCPSPARGKGITARAVLLGLALVVANSFWLVDLEMIESRSYPSDLALFLNVIAFLLLLLALNRLLRAVAPRYVLAHPGRAGGDLCHAGDGHRRLRPEHHAGAGEQPGARGVVCLAREPLGHQLLPHFPDWLVVKDRWALRGFYLGGVRR